jgi:predicted AlkP superfamily pyrophosphatase or phosphodiesterase
MEPTVVFLSLPALRPQDLERMPRLSALGTERAQFAPSFPAVTWPVQANMITGQLPNRHGVIANGFYWRDQQQVEMWTAPNSVIELPQIWDQLHARDPQLTSAVWFPMLSKRCGADFICMPAPVHNPDGSETMWCYTRPQEFYGELREQLGDFPLQRFWGPLANIESSAWIAKSAVLAAEKFRPRLLFIYLPHLDYATQRDGPDSPAAMQALSELDQVVGDLADQLGDVYPGDQLTWLYASEYVVTEVDHVLYPNRILREAGYLKTLAVESGELIDFEQSDVWALVDHQCSHIFLRHPNQDLQQKIHDLFRDRSGVAEVLVGPQRQKYGLDHKRSGDIILVSPTHSWQAYYWWMDDRRAPDFARTVDIHRKPGYDPVELHFDRATKSIPLKPELVRGSHGAPVLEPRQHGVLAASRHNVLPAKILQDIDVAGIIQQCLGLSPH